MEERNNETPERNTVEYSAAGIPRFGTDRESGGKPASNGHGTSDGGGTGIHPQSFRERVRRFSGTDEQSDNGTDEPKQRKQRSDAGTARTTRRRRAVTASPLGDLITEGLGALTGIAAVSRGPHWNIPPDKLARVGQAYGAVVDYYFPHEKIGEASLIGGAAIATASAFGPPLVVDMLNAKAAAAEILRQRQTQQQAAYAPQAGYTAPQSPPFGYQPPPAPQPSPGSLFGMSEEELAAAMQAAMSFMQGMGTDAPANGE